MLMFWMLVSALSNSSMMNFLKIECIKNIKTCNSILFGSDRSSRNANLRLSVCLFVSNLSRTHNLHHFGSDSSWWLQDVFRMSSGCLQDVFRMTSGWLQDDFRTTSGWLQEDYRMTAGWLQDDYGMTTGWLRDDYRMSSGWLQSGSVCCLSQVCLRSVSSLNLLHHTVGA